MSHPNPAYTLLTATPADVPRIVALIDEAFVDDNLMRALRAKIDPELLRVRNEKRCAEGFIYARLTGMRTVLAIENSTGEAVGVAQWEFPVQLNDAEEAEKEVMNAAQRAEVPPEGANVSLEEDFFGSIVAMKKKYCDPEQDLYLSLLGVARAHHRRGIASILLADGIAHADRLGKKMFLIASPMGLPLYLRLGWARVDEVIIDMAKHGLDASTEAGTCVLREPKALGSTAEGTELNALGRAEAELVPGAQGEGAGVVPAI